GNDDGNVRYLLNHGCVPCPRQQIHREGRFFAKVLSADFLERIERIIAAQSAQSVPQSVDSRLPSL
ncbi:MAG: hypothetical protein AAB427_06150, partial [Chloroflexota bacterium]